MGVDYDGVGGVGIQITEEMFEKVRGYLIRNDIPLMEDWGRREFLDTFGLSYSEAGDALYGGEARFYWLIKGMTLTDVLTNMPEFLEHLQNAKIDVDEEDLKIISDLYVW